MKKPQLPDNDARRTAALEREQAAGVTASPTEWVLQGKRTDLPEGYGPRMKITATSIIKYAQDGTPTTVA